MTDIAHPFHFDARGRTGRADEDAHVRDLIEAVLFTSPGERVNRPDFGSGLLDLVFAPGGDSVAAAVEMSVQGALQTWVGDRIRIEELDVAAKESELTVIVRYRRLPLGELVEESFTRSAPA